MVGVVGWILADFVTCWCYLVCGITYVWVLLLSCEYLLFGFGGCFRVAGL